MIGRGVAALVLGALGLTTLAVVPAQASETTTPTSWTVNTAALTALSRATELATFASIKAGVLAPGDAAMTPPDVRTLSQDAQGLASYINALPSDVRSQSFAQAPGVGVDLSTITNGLADLLNVGTLPDVSGFLGSALRIVTGLQIIYTVPDLGGTVDVGALADSAVSLTTYLTGQAGQLAAQAQAIISNLPTVDELNDTVRAEVAYFAHEVNLPDTSGWLLEADALLIWLGQQIVGPLGIAGPTIEQALDAAGSLANALSDLADGLDPDPNVSVEPAPIPEDLTLAAVDVGPSHDFLPDIVDPAVANISGANVGTTTDSIQDTAATATGYRCYTRNHEACAPPLTWHGGKVQHKPRVNVIFWGPKWSSRTDLQGAVTGMFGSLSGSGFQSVLSQHYDATGSVSASMTYGGAWVDTSAPPAALNSTLLVNEAIRAAKAKGWGTSDDVTWMIYPQAGVASANSHGSFAHCGFHGNGTDNTGRRWVFGVVDYPAPTTAYDYSGCAGGNVGSVSADLTAGGSHEYAEAVTDPFFTGWYDAAGQENADLCAAQAPVGGIVPLWSNDGRAGYCTLSFTPRYTYKVTSAVAPAGEGLNGYARGHNYLGGHVVATNTGNMPWFPGGSSPTRLGTWGPADRCSHSADMNTKDKANPWVSCRRIRMAGTYPVEPTGVSAGTSSATFDVRLKPDGAISDSVNYPEQFNLVSSVWMGPSSGSSPTLTVKTAKYDAVHVTPATGDPIVAGVAGLDVPVQLDFTVKGTAPWYTNEAVYLGTAGPSGNGHASVWAASTWPRSGACSKCRAVRVSATSHPAETYTFKFTVHIPSTMPTGVYKEYFRPVADVAINGGGVGAKYFGPAVPVTIAVAGVPVGTHEITATGTIGSEPTEGYNTSDVTTPTPYGHWFACMAVATADAVSTSIDSCSIEVTHADGTAAYSMWAGGSGGSGGVAVMTGRGVTYDEASGDTARVCWNASATYADGTTKATSACTT